MQKQNKDIKQLHCYNFIQRNLQMSLQDFQVLSKLGEGTYSVVYKVKRLQDESIYALKKVKLINLTQKQIHNSVNQVRILASIRHPNIIGYKQAFYDVHSNSLCIIMQYADGGDLLQKIFQYKSRNMEFAEQYVWDIFYQVLNGLKALHDLKILHRDIKSANVFLTKSGFAKLGDMNVSKVIRKDAMCQTQTGTPYYASPEVWHDDPYDAKSDVWSLGIVLYEFIALKPPFRARDMEGLYRKVTRGYYSRIGKSYSQDLADFVQKLIKVKPEQRLSCSNNKDKVGELMQDPLLKKRIKKFHLGIGDLETEEKSVLLKTIKLSKNINYLTQRLPQPNYSPLRYKSLSSVNRSSIDKIHPKNINDMSVSLQLSLPPIGLTQNRRGAKKYMMNPKLIRSQSIQEHSSRPSLNLNRKKISNISLA